MDTVVVTRTFESDLDAMVAYTRSLQSRTSWPGSQLEFEKTDTLYYGVGMRLKAAAMTDITVEEKLGDVERLDGGEVRYTTTQRVTWPDGHADATTEYLFSPGAAGEPNSLRFTYSYEPPSGKLVKAKELPAFHVAMEKVSARYLKGLSAAPVSA